MLNLVKKAFRIYLEFLLWVVVVGCAITGWKLGGWLGEGGMFSRGHDEYAFYGVVVGAIVGMLINIIGGGTIATLLAIENNTAKTEENTSAALKVLERMAYNAGGTGGGAKNASAGSGTDARFATIFKD